MSDIPVGSPPVPPGRHAAPGGWYADPVDPARERYWDGWQWSRNTRPSESQPPAAARGASARGAAPSAAGDACQAARNPGPGEPRPPAAAGGRPTGYAPPGPTVPPG